MVDFHKYLRKEGRKVGGKEGGREGKRGKGVKGKEKEIPYDVS